MTTTNKEEQTMSDFILPGTGSRSLQTADAETKRQVWDLTIAELIKLKEEHGAALVVMSGMAEGFDKLLAKAALSLDIRLWCAVPNKRYGSYYWARNSLTKENKIEEFDSILARAEKVIYVMEDVHGSTGLYKDGRHANFIRNDYMVEAGDAFLVWDPTSKGTKDCLRTITAAGKPHTILTLTKEEETVMTTEEQIDAIIDEQSRKKVVDLTPAPKDDTKEVHMNKLYFFETTKTIGGLPLPVLVITNAPNPVEKAAYERFEELAKKEHPIRCEEIIKAEFKFYFRVKHLGPGRTMPFLEKVIGETHDYRLERFKFSARDELDNVVQIITFGEHLEPLKTYIGKSTRSWSTSTSLNVLFVKGVKWDEFDDVFHTKTGNSAKMAKRMAEYVRVTSQYKFLEPKNFRLAYLPDHPLGEGAYDGQSIVSETLVRLCIKTNPDPMERIRLEEELDDALNGKSDGISWSLRVWTPMGLIKGDCIPASDKQLWNKYGYVPHVITHPCNNKSEFASKDFFLVTLNPHHPHHTPSISAQLMSWTKELFAPYTRLMKDFSAYLKEFDNALVNGIAPAHLMRTMDPHDEEGDFQPNVAIKLIDNQVTRFNSTGFDLMYSSYLTARVVQGFMMKIEKDIKALKLPMPWSALTHCTTVAMLEAANYDLSAYDTNKMFYHRPTGRMCWPTAEFIKNGNRHGGHDLDDSHTISIRIAEDENGDFEIGGKRWTPKALIARSPNGLTYHGPDELPGEYSVIDIDLGIGVNFMGMPTLNFPLYNCYGPILGLHMDRAPKLTHHQVVTHNELPSDEPEEVTDPKVARKITLLQAKADGTNYPHEREAFLAKIEALKVKGGIAINNDIYTVSVAQRSFVLALTNPGIGSIINPLIAYSAIFGDYPDSLPARLEQMVDCLEQTPSFVGFELVEQAKAQIIDAIIHSGVEVDDFILRTRLSQSKQRKIRFDRRTKDTPFAIIAQAMMDPSILVDRLLGDAHKDDKEWMKKWAFVEGLMGFTTLKAKWFGKNNNYDTGLAVRRRITIPELMSYTVTDENMRVAWAIFRKFGAERGHAPQSKKVYNPKTQKNEWVPDPYVSYARRMFFVNLNETLVDMLLEKQDNGTDWADIIVGLYQIVINEGTQDNVLFQTSDQGTTDGIFDYFLRTLYVLGLSPFNVYIDDEGKVQED